MDTNQYQQEFGRRVRRRRMACGLMQKELAERLDWPQGHVSRLEKGEFLLMRLERLVLLADALMTSADYLLGRLDDPEAIPLAQAATADACL